MHQTPLHELFNLRWYIQHLIDESGDELENPLHEENWMKQTNWKFIKYVTHYKHSMTPEQLKKKPFKPIIKIGHEKLDTEEGESNTDEEEYNISSEMSEEDSESDTTADDTQESKPTETVQDHNVCNQSTHDENDSYEHVTDIEPYKENGEQKIGIEDKLLSTNFEVKNENQKLKTES